MPYTPKEVRFLLSDGSPVGAVQKENIKSELHANPALGHHRRGSASMRRGPRKRSRMAEAFRRARR